MYLKFLFWITMNYLKYLDLIFCYQKNLLLFIIIYYYLQLVICLGNMERPLSITVAHCWNQCYI